MQTQTRKNIRLQGYDYSKEGAYFITICSKDRKCIFGEIVVGAGLVSARSEQTELTKLGRIIEKHWHDIPSQFNNVELDEFIVMPNHIHGILILHNLSAWADTRPAPTVFRETLRLAPTTISDIICSFKSKCSVEYFDYMKQRNLYHPGGIWQRGYYDHIIRAEESLNSIREYIMFNPSTWDKDENNLTHKNMI